MMKNILGTTEYLELFNKKGKRVYEFYKYPNGHWYERKYDFNGNTLTFKDSDRFWYECTYDSNGNELTFKNSKGYWFEYTRDSNGNDLTYKDSDRFWYECTYDSNGNELTYKDSNGETRGFDIPEYTMEQLVEKLGNFKIKK